jgi:putative toxin-antitoxin system antitoxin component (TIGR02293 family)
METTLTSTGADVVEAPFETLDGSRVLWLDEGQGPELLRSGLPAGSFETLREVLGAPVSELASAVGIAPRTLARRVAGGSLSASESDRLLRLARLTEQAMHALGSSSSGAQWMRSPHRLLGGETPLVHADTNPGAERVATLLYGIEYTSAF